jgi:hypothetical protein
MTKVMTKDEFLQVCKELYKRGYHRNFKMKDLYKHDYTGLFNNYYKVIDRGCDKYGDSRAITQLFFRPWSLWEYRNSLPDKKNWLSFEPVIMFSRSADERVDLSLQFPERSIDELEQIAKNFGEWCKQNIKEIED